MKKLFKDLFRKHTKLEVENDLIFIEKVKKNTIIFWSIVLFLLLCIFNFYCFYKFYYEQNLLFGLLCIISYVLIGIVVFTVNEKNK